MTRWTAAFTRPISNSNSSATASSKAGRAAVRAAFVAIVILCFAGTADAHAMLESSNPAPGARLDQAPAQVVVTLTESIDSSSARLRVLNQTGQRVDLNDLQVTSGDHPVLTASLQSPLPDGAYRILWSGVSQDTHPVTGTIGFAVGAFEPPASSATGGATPTAIVGRVLVYAGLALALGGILFIAGMPDSAVTSSRVPRTAMFAGANLHVAGIALLAYAYVQSNPAGWRDAAMSDAGRVLAVRVILSAGALALLFFGLFPLTRHNLQPGLAATMLAMAGIGSALMGHPIVQGVAAVAVDAIHLLASLLWVGGLAIFLWLLRNDGAQMESPVLLRVGLRFGTFALLSVITLFAAGSASALILAGPRWLGHPLDLIQSPWGAYLATKIGLAVVMVALAGFNRFVLLAPPQTRGLAGRLQTAAARITPGLRPLAAGGSPAALRRAVALEASLGAIVLVLAAILASIAPPIQ